ncbi:hemicentin-1-like [Halichoeres trimaculatus]|uniref:hemicentin-1-like n=1 Tax=Halichoeres trimaculatus TaxID=147232 RepID=UPI003D9EE2FF
MPRETGMAESIGRAVLAASYGVSYITCCKATALGVSNSLISPGPATSSTSTGTSYRTVYSHSPVVVTEDGDVVLPCSLSSKENLESALFDWKKDLEKGKEERVFMYNAGLYSGRDFDDQDKQFKGRVSFFQEELKNGNTSIKITKTKVSDSGTYTCIFPNLQHSPKFSVQLVVGTCPKPFAKQIDASNDWSQLQCVVRGASPKPVVEWKDSSGNILPAKHPEITERGGRYDIILQTTVTKSGNYRCVVTQEEFCHQSHDDAFVHLPDPAAESSGPVVVTEDSDVVLPCSLSSKENLESALFDWKKDLEKGKEERVFMYNAGLYSGRDFDDQDKQFKGRVSIFQEELKNGNTSIKITKTRVSDSGTYTCIFPNHQHSPKFSVQLVVGTCPKPSTKQINGTNDWSQLQCVVRGASPKPVVEWKDSSGNILPAEDPEITERGGRYDIILQTTVTKSDNYRCIVTQEEFCHQSHDDVFVHLPGAAPEPSVTILEDTEKWSLLQCVVRGASPKPVVEWRDSSGNILPAKEAQVTERGGSYDIVLQTTVTKTDHYSCVVTQEEINHRTEAKIHVFMSGPVVVTEDGDVVLPCSLSSKENLESALFDWKKDLEKGKEERVFMYNAGLYSGRDFDDQDKQFKGRVSFFQEELKNGNTSIKITKTKLSDSGTYTCIFPNLQHSPKFSVQLVVGTCPKPSTKQIKTTNDWWQLQCVVRGASPKPVVEWKDSSGNILPAEDPETTERGGRYDIILQTTVTKSDNYSCVVTQEEFCHQLHDDILVHLPGALRTSGPPRYPKLSPGAPGPPGEPGQPRRPEPPEPPGPGSSVP